MTGPKTVRSVLFVGWFVIMHTTGVETAKNVLSVARPKKILTIGQKIVKNVRSVEPNALILITGMNVNVWFATKIAINGTDASALIVASHAIRMTGVGIARSVRFVVRRFLTPICGQLVGV